MVTPPRPRTHRRTVAVLVTALLGTAALLLPACTSSTGNGPDGVTGSTTSAPRVPAPRSDGSGLIPPDQTGTSRPGSGAPTSASATPAVPQAPSLSWLTGAHVSDGLVMDTDGGKRWQSKTPGEYAVIHDGWYRYFAPDGSMVGCTSDAKCVGVDGAGHVAVTDGPDDPRLVYDADGSFLGRYSSAGEPLKDRGKPPGMERAIAESGVDVAGLVNAATLGAPFAGGATGDPHLITAGGVRVTTQAVGQFVARGGDPAHRIQLQLTPMAHRDDVSIVSAVAIGADGDVVVANDSGGVTVNGRTVGRRGELRDVALSDGAVVGLWPGEDDGVATTAVVWPDGGSVVLAANPALGITVVAHLPDVAGAVGLFGTGGQGPGPDLHARGGEAANTPSIITSWHVTSSERLFTPRSDTAPSFPTKTATIDPGAKKVAQNACSGHGITHREDVAACAFDVALTGDTGFVPGHVALAVPAEHDAVARRFAVRWPALLPRLAAEAPDLPANGRIDVQLSAGSTRAFRVDLKQPGSVLLVNRAGCAPGERQPGMDTAAMRVFDAAGHAVSDRFGFCGHDETPTLPAGSYDLVLANGAKGPDMTARVDVTLR